MHPKVKQEPQQLKSININTHWPVFMCIHWDDALQTKTWWWNKKQAATQQPLLLDVLVTRQGSLTKPPEDEEVT